MTRRFVLGLFAVAIIGAVPRAEQQPTRFVLAAAGNEARYRVREQFLNVNLPSDAIGATTAVTGGIAIDTAGKVVAAGSKLVVDIRTLKSDSENRDRIIQGRTLETERFPHVEIAVKELRGLAFPWPMGELKFELVGDLTVHGVTKPSTWQVTATKKESGLAGRATTAFKFGDFGMVVPTSFRLLSVEDNIRLEYDFHLVPAK